LKELDLYAGAPKTQKDGVVPVARINPRLIKKMLLLQESFLQQMATLPYRASMQRLMIKLLRMERQIDERPIQVPERKDRSSFDSRIPESKGSSSFPILGAKNG
jgi:hypothetical protein